MADMHTHLDAGTVQWHTSEEDGLPDVGMLLQIDADNALWIGEISRSLWSEGGADAAALGSDFGWWIIHYGKSEAKIIGKCIAGFPELDCEIIDFLSAAIRRAPSQDAETIKALREALTEIEDLGSDGEHSGDRHARCREIARAALAGSAS